MGNAKASEEIILLRKEIAYCAKRLNEAEEDLTPQMSEVNRKRQDDLIVYWRKRAEDVRERLTKEINKSRGDL